MWRQAHTTLISSCVAHSEQEKITVRVSERYCTGSFQRLLQHPFYGRLRMRGQYASGIVPTPNFDKILEHARSEFEQDLKEQRTHYMRDFVLPPENKQIISSNIVQKENNAGVQVSTECQTTPVENLVQSVHVQTRRKNMKDTSVQTNLVKLRPLKLLARIGNPCEKILPSTEKMSYLEDWMKDYQYLLKDYHLNEPALLENSTNDQLPPTSASDCSCEVEIDVLDQIVQEEVSN